MVCTQLAPRTYVCTSTPECHQESQTNKQTTSSVCTHARTHVHAYLWLYPLIHCSSRNLSYYSAPRVLLLPVLLRRRPFCSNLIFKRHRDPHPFSRIKTIQRVRMNHRGSEGRQRRNTSFQKDQESEEKYFSTHLCRRCDFYLSGVS